MVSSYTQLLERRYRGRLDADEFIDYAVSGASRMQAMLQDLLTYSRVSSQGAEPRPTDSGQVVQEALLSLRTRIEESQARVDLEGLPTVMADRSQLLQVFHNLLGNALKFAGDAAPVVRITAERHGRDWVFAVRDNGIGIDGKYSERVFQIFQRLHPQEEYEGTGIGLALCEKIIRRHNGRIWLASKPGEGTTFFFNLPAAEEKTSERVPARLIAR